MTRTTAAIACHDLSKRFGRHEVLHRISFDVERGTVFGVIGPNGAGKTTTMRILLDIIRPSSGSLTVLGQNPTGSNAALRRRIGYLPGELRLPARLTANALLKHFAAISGPVEPGRIEELAERFNLPLHQRLGTLSKGNKQKVGLVQAFMHRPELLVLDEPTSGLDPLVQQTFHELVRSACADGQTVFLSSHVLSEVQETANRVAILRDGNVLATSTVAALQANAQRSIHARLVLDRPIDFGESMHHVPGLTDVNIVPADHGTMTLTGKLSGEVDPFIRALAFAHHILDLTIEEPDLEESVLGIYRGDSTVLPSELPTMPSETKAPELPQTEHSTSHYGRHSK